MKVKESCLVVNKHNIVAFWIIIDSWQTDENNTFSALTLLVLGVRKGIQPVKTGCWFVSVDDLTRALHDL